MQIAIAEQIFAIVTDEEGYFELNTTFDTPIAILKERWVPCEIRLVDNNDTPADDIVETTQILFPSKTAQYGVISDIDDTVLQTHTTSLFKLKMLYASFFLAPFERLPLEGINNLYAEIAGGMVENPIFCVSNSPWNIYDNLIKFLDFQRFPKGPVLLRDISMDMIRHRNQPQLSHKIKTISHILETYADLPFILLGDTTSKDADYYMSLAQEYGDQIRAIYIRHTKKSKNLKRVAQLIESKASTNTVVIRHTAEIREDLLAKGLL